MRRHSTLAAKQWTPENEVDIDIDFWHPSLPLTRIPSQRDTALSGRSARKVLIDLNAGMSAAPAIIAAKFISDS